MAKRKKFQKFFRYECSLTGESFKTTKEAKNPQELVSIKAYYDMHADQDDRPVHFKLMAEQEAQLNPLDELFGTGEASADKKEDVTSKD